MREANSPSRSIPLAIKLVYSAFVALHLLVNLRFYGPLNYLWFCDIAVLIACLGLWMENRLLLGMSAICLFGPSALWSADLLSKLVRGHGLTGWTDYMEDPSLPLILRAASAFHIWLPLLLLFCLYRLGYDRRSLWLQTAFAVVVLTLSRLIGPPPPAHDIHQVVNINCAWGMSDAAPQTKLPAALYLLKVMLKAWIGMYLPAHLLLIGVTRIEQAIALTTAAEKNRPRSILTE